MSRLLSYIPKKICNSAPLCPLCKTRWARAFARLRFVRTTCFGMFPSRAAGARTAGILTASPSATRKRGICDHKGSQKVSKNFLGRGAAPALNGRVASESRLQGEGCSDEARPGKQPTGLFSLRQTKLFSCNSRANRSLSFAPPPSNPSLCSVRRKKELANANSFFRGGRRGIRTPGGVTLNGFQDRRVRPLRHPSVSAPPRESRCLLFYVPSLNGASRGRRAPACPRPSACR